MHSTLILRAATVILALAGSVTATYAQQGDPPAGADWQSMLDAAAALTEEQHDPRSVFSFRDFAMAAERLDSDPAGALQVIRSMDEIVQDRLTIPLERADLEAIVTAAVVGSGAPVPNVPLGEEDVSGVRGGLEQALGDAGLSPENAPDVLAFHAVTVWLAMSGREGQVPYAPTMQAVRDQVLLVESQRASLIGAGDELRDVRNTLLAQAVMVGQASDQAHHADEGDGFRSMAEQHFGELFDGLRLGPPEGAPQGPNLFQAAN